MTKIIKYIQGGNIFDSGCEVIVNPVNCVGISGKGLALEFKKRLPSNYSAYRDACESGLLRPGSVYMVDVDNYYACSKSIANLATKDHWKNPSKLEWIEQGLVDLLAKLQSGGYSSVAIPALGCGCGELRWADVRKLIEATFSDREDLEVLVYEPR